jgi:hypothetical protein
VHHCARALGRDEPDDEDAGQRERGHDRFVRERAEILAGEAGETVSDP